ncbi:hypothetical protein F4803DRAFT_559999 [Xylaria telfairii]|nr:hypothetical protein F4803DRAFT_559999 [Xylaria telfairii]
MSQNNSIPSNSKTRDSPPSLFLHPSPSASHISLPGINTSAAPPLSSGMNPGSQFPSDASAQQSQPPLTRTGSLLNPRNRPVPRLPTGDSARTADRTDALWAEMQATLEEAELSASGGTHVFGPDHDRKLAELRVAQIALAQAWGRSEADDTAGGSMASETEVRNLKGALGDGPAEGTDAGKSTIGTGSAQPSSSGLDGEKLGAKLEEETERDILLARNRREANDRYFSKVDQGVRDVVAKLEDVAIAMRAVEQETRGLWGEESAVESVDN